VPPKKSEYRITESYFLRQLIKSKKYSTEDDKLFSLSSEAHYIKGLLNLPNILTTVPPLTERFENWSASDDKTSLPELCV
jgi:hypothetical protein